MNVTIVVKQCGKLVGRRLRQKAFYVKGGVDKLPEGLARNKLGAVHIGWGPDLDLAWQTSKVVAGW